MTYPKPSDSEAGMILVDILLALGLAAIFISGMTAATLEAEGLFARAADRSMMIRMYEDNTSQFGSLLPYESLERTYAVGSTSEPVTVKAAAGWYGNDQIETDIVTTYRGRSISFTAVRNYPFKDIANAGGTPLCAARMSLEQLHDQPPIITAISLPIPPLLPLTDAVVRDGVAYLSADSNTASDPDLIIADIKDQKHPSVLSELNTGPGLSALTMAGKYIFAAAASTVAQLHVIRLDNLAAPVLVKKYRLPLPEASTTPQPGSAIFFNDNMVYLGTEKWDGEELSVINVSDPENPFKIGGFETGSKVNDIYVRNGLAYVAASDLDQLRAIDVRDPAHPISLNAFSPSGSGRQEGKTLAYFEDELNLGRTSGGFDIQADHESFSFPATSSEISVYKPMRPPNVSSALSSLNVPGGVYGTIIDREHVYLATRNLDQEFMALDRNLSTSTATSYALPVAPKMMTCDQDNLYILAKTAPVIYEITFNK